jgi:hypothetical protein
MQFIADVRNGSRVNAKEDRKARALDKGRHSDPQDACSRKEKDYQHRAPAQANRRRHVSASLEARCDVGIASVVARSCVPESQRDGGQGCEGPPRGGDCGEVLHALYRATRSSVDRQLIEHRFLAPSPLGQGPNPRSALFMRRPRSAAR